MSDTTIKKVNSGFSPSGKLGQKYLVSGTAVAMRLWQEPAGPPTPQPSRRDYETVGFVIDGRAELELEGQKVLLEKGDSWLVPEGAVHRYHVLDDFTAVEATSPPARVEGRDDPLTPAGG